MPNETHCDETGNQLCHSLNLNSITKQPQHDNVFVFQDKKLFEGLVKPSSHIQSSLSADASGVWSPSFESAIVRLKIDGKNW